MSMYRSVEIFLNPAAVAVAIVLMMTACSKSAPGPVMGNCRFNVCVEPEIITKSGASGMETVLADRCLMEIFYGDVSLGIDTVALTSGKASFNVQVIPGRTYDIVFWADKAGCYKTESLKSVQFHDNGYDLADNSMDAFCAVCRNVSVSDDDEIQNITLNRALAKISCTNFPGNPVITFSASGSFNLLDDTYGSNKTFTYNNNFFFVFATDETSRMDIQIGDKNCTDVPVRRNYLTNIRYSE